MEIFFIIRRLKALQKRDAGPASLVLMAQLPTLVRLLVLVLPAFACVLAGSALAGTEKAASSQAILETLENYDEQSGQFRQAAVPGVEIRRYGPQSYMNRAGGKLVLHMNYPQGLGNVAVDADVAAYAEKIWQEWLADAKEFTEDEDPEVGVSYNLSLVFTLAKPAPDFVSVVFYYYAWFGGVHPNFTLDSLSYDLRGGKKLTAADIFPDLASSQNFAELINERFVACTDEEKKNKDCIWLKSASDILADTGFFILTPEGLAVIYPPYEIGSYASGSQCLDIPKKELARLGLNIGFWP